MQNAGRQRAVQVPLDDAYGGTKEGKFAVPQAGSGTQPASNGDGEGTEFRCITCNRGPPNTKKYAKNQCQTCYKKVKRNYLPSGQASGASFLPPYYAGAQGPSPQLHASGYANYSHHGPNPHHRLAHDYHQGGSDSL